MEPPSSNLISRTTYTTNLKTIEALDSSEVEINCSHIRQFKCHFYIYSKNEFSRIIKISFTNRP